MPQHQASIITDLTTVSRPTTPLTHPSPLPPPPSPQPTPLSHSPQQTSSSIPTLDSSQDHASPGLQSASQPNQSVNQRDLQPMPQNFFFYNHLQSLSPSTIPSSAENPPSTNHSNSASNGGPIRSSHPRHPRRRRLALSTSPYADVPALFRRLAKVSGALFSESKPGDLDEKLDDVVGFGVEDDVEDGVGGVIGSVGGVGGAIGVSGVVSGLNTPVSGAGKRLDELEFHRRRAECPVCWENLKSVALQCGHQCCHRCAANLQKCHSCRSQILLRIKLF